MCILLSKISLLNNTYFPNDLECSMLRSHRMTACNAVMCLSEGLKVDKNDIFKFKSTETNKVF
jgi:hypothetical protein